MPSNHLILCRPLLLLPSIFPSIRVFSNESVLLTRWPKYWSFSFSISPSNGYSGLISSRIDWFHLLAVQGTLKSLFPPQCKVVFLKRCWAWDHSSSYRERELLKSALCSIEMKICNCSCLCFVTWKEAFLEVLLPNTVLLNPWLTTGFGLRVSLLNLFEQVKIKMYIKWV